MDVFLVDLLFENDNPYRPTLDRPSRSQTKTSDAQREERFKSVASYPRVPHAAGGYGGNQLVAASGEVEKEGCMRASLGRRCLLVVRYIETTWTCSVHFLSLVSLPRVSLTWPPYPDASCTCLASLSSRTVLEVRSHPDATHPPRGKSL